jgi:hypothetical protein
MLRNYHSPENPRPVNLLSWLQSDKYADQVKLIRQTADKSRTGSVQKPNCLLSQAEVLILTGKPLD